MLQPCRVNSEAGFSIIKNILQDGRDPRLDSRSDAFPGALDLSILDSKLLSSSTRRQSDPWSSSSSSDREPLDHASRSFVPRRSGEFLPFSSSIHLDSLQEEYSGLCQGCIRRFVSDKFFESFSKNPTPTPFTYTQEIADLAATATSCKFCDELWHHYDDLWGYLSEDEWVTAVVTLSPEMDSHNECLRSLRIHVAPVQERDRKPPYTRVQKGQFWVHTENGDPATCRISAREVNNRVHSPHALEKAQQWIDTCIIQHTSCGKPGSRDLPTRLLDVSKPGIRLRPTEDLAETFYAALSYCWGGSQFQPNQLKDGPDGNFDHFLRGVPLSTFPQVIQDAITVTRKLGLHFIWIDSACIIQNDEEDKRKEIAKMRRIYSNSYVTIVASASATAADGFLHDRDPPPQPIKLPFPCAGGALGSMQLRGKWGSGWIQYDITSSHTDKRAWTMEEKLLSPRVLMYTDKQLRWICNTTRDCDGGHIESYHNDLVLDPGGVMYVGLGVEPDRLDEYMSAATSSVRDEHERLKNAWGVLVTCYTRRSVTHGKDRLRAIGGIAEEFSKRTGYHYVAGMWRETLQYDLLWMEQNPIDNPPHVWDKSELEDPSYFLKNAKQAAAPSWSWASGHYPITVWIQGPIDFVDFSIVGYDIILQSEQRLYADILSGALTLRGRVRKAYILGSSTLQVRGAQNRRNGLPSWPTVGTANLDPFRSDVIADIRTYEGESRQEIFLINFGTYNDGQESVGLMLAPATVSDVEAGRKVYKRIGMYTAWGFRRELKGWDIADVVLV